MRVVRALSPAAALVLLLAAPAGAGPATDRLREFFGSVDSVLADPSTAERPQDKVAVVQRLVADLADPESAAAGALGGEWPARTPGERDEFVGLFAALLERAWVGGLAGPPA
jgi:ABC-type transporter MlaC component